LAIPPTMDGGGLAETAEFKGQTRRKRRRVRGRRM
jgi:hypothetical protein